jgi:hypothetical protein
MIRYALVCDKHHEFESWFANSAAYDKQARRGLVACPSCGSVKVEKALMAPRLARTDLSSPEPSPHPPSARQEPRQESRQESSHHASGEEAPAPQPAEAAPGVAAPPAPVAMMSPHERELRQKLRELRDHIVKNAENVGQRFPEEARKMHYGEAEHRSIYGIASPQDAEALHEEGVAFSALPVLPDDRN